MPAMRPRPSASGTNGLLNEGSLQMLIALLVVLGVDLIYIVAFIGFVVARRRWVKRQPDAFAGAIRVSSGEIEGLGPKWKRGYGRRVRDVLVWTNAPLMLQNELVPVDQLVGERPAHGGEVKRLGNEPVVIELASDGAKIEIAARAEHRALVIGPLTTPSTPAPSTTAAV